jgi:hypothetical protein
MGYNITIIDQRKENKLALTNEIILNNDNDPLIPNMSE